MSDNRSPLLFSDSTRIGEADYRFNWENDHLLKYGKDLSNEETTRGIRRYCKTEPGFLVGFRQRVVDAMSTEDYQCWWEDIIYRTIDRGDEVFIRDIAGKFWAEVDYIEDYERIRAFMRKKPRNLIKWVIKMTH